MGYANHPPGTIGISTSGYGWRHGSTVIALLGCWKPDGTRVLNAESIDLVDNWNGIIRRMSGDWLWMQADDHTWGGQALKVLLDAEVDVVVPLILRRGPPFVPLIYKELTSEGYVPFAYDELPESGLVECRMVATGGALIRKRVFEEIGDPWFEYEAGDNLSEDFTFMERIYQAGFKLHACVDEEALHGHIGKFTIWPNLKDGRWQIGFDMGSNKAGEKSTFFFDPNDTPQ